MSQKRTLNSVSSPATNSHIKGLQNYYTPIPWAKALAALLPAKRFSIADLQCGSGSLLVGLTNASTEYIYASDLDASTSPLNRVHFNPNTTVTHAHIDYLDLLPCLLDTRTKFDLLACNPPFSLTWPQSLLPLSLRNGGDTIDSTTACLASIKHLLTNDGECLFIANASTIERISAADPSLLDHVWFHLTIPSFFHNANFTASILYIAKRYRGKPPAPMHLTPGSPDELLGILTSWQHLRPPGGIMGIAWPNSRFSASVTEARYRVNPENRPDNVILSLGGTLRTQASAYQRFNDSIPEAQHKALQSINHANPFELTVQRATRQALAEILDQGCWTMSDSAAHAIRNAMEEYNRSRTPLTPVSPLQRLGWLDENDNLLCTQDFLSFRAGKLYEVTSEVAKYEFSHYKPRYKNGKKDEEQLSTRGNDLIFTIHGADDFTAQFTYKHSHIKGTYPMELIGQHFQIPEVPSLKIVRPEECAAHEKRLDLLESITSKYD